MCNINKKIFFILKEHSLIHQVLLNTLLAKKYSYLDLEIILGVKKEKLYKVQNGEEKLEQDSILKLIGLFYDTI